MNDTKLKYQHWGLFSSRKKDTYKKLEKSLRHAQRCLSRKQENKKKGKATNSAKNIEKQILTIQKLHQRLANARTDYVNKIVSELVKTKPVYMTIEDLNVRGMMKNRHLSKAVAQQNFYYFRTQLALKCRQYGIELRVVSRWYPSSKTCSCCGNIKNDLKLSERTYVCANCGLEINRDFNASVNLKNAERLYRRLLKPPCIEVPMASRDFKTCGVLNPCSRLSLQLVETEHDETIIFWIQKVNTFVYIFSSKILWKQN